MINRMRCTARLLAMLCALAAAATLALYWVTIAGEGPVVGADLRYADDGSRVRLHPVAQFQVLSVVPVLLVMLRRPGSGAGAHVS